MDFDKIFLEHAALVGSTDKQQGKKVYNFLKRNKDRNAHLYLLPEDRVNIDFIVCPVLGTRTLNIKKMYIENVLLMTVESFKETYPDQLLSCKGLTKAIGAGLQEIDEETGLTKHQLSALKSKETRSEVGEDGLTSYERSGIKTKETHMSRIDENGLNGYQRIAKDARPKQIETMQKEGLRSGNNSLFSAYRNFVDWLGYNNKKIIMEGRETGKMGTDGAEQCDHLYSVVNGFNNKVSPWVIAHIDNMNAISWEENASKKATSDIELDYLLKIINMTKEDSEYEFSLIIGVVEELLNDSSISTILSAEVLERFNNKSNNKRVRF